MRHYSREATNILALYLNSLSHLLRTPLGTRHQTHGPSAWFSTATAVLLWSLHSQNHVHNNSTLSHTFLCTLLLLKWEDLKSVPIPNPDSRHSVQPQSLVTKSPKFLPIPCAAPTYSPHSWSHVSHTPHWSKEEDTWGIRAGSSHILQQEV